MLFYLGLFYAVFLPFVPHIGNEVARLSGCLLTGEVGEFDYSQWWEE